MTNGHAPSDVTGGHDYRRAILIALDLIEHLIVLQRPKIPGAESKRMLEQADEAWQLLQPAPDEESETWRANLP